MRNKTQTISILVLAGILWPLALACYLDGTIAWIMATTLAVCVSVYVTVEQAHSPVVSNELVEEK